MITRINFTEFCDGLDKGSGFSYEGKKVLFDYLESLEDDMGEQIEFDPVAIRCEYDEMDIDELMENFSELSEQCTAYHEEDEEEPSVEQWIEIHEMATQFLEENTVLCGVSKDNTYIFQSF